jgi:hypothetical protein
MAARMLTGNAKVIGCPSRCATFSQKTPWESRVARRGGGFSSRVHSLNATDVRQTRRILYLESTHATGGHESSQRRRGHKQSTKLTFRRSPLRAEFIVAPLRATFVRAQESENCLLLPTRSRIACEASPSFHRSQSLPRMFAHSWKLRSHVRLGTDGR